MEEIGGLRRSPLLCVQVLQLRVKDTCRCALLMLRHAVPCYLDITCFGLVVFWELFLLHSFIARGCTSLVHVICTVFSLIRLPLLFWCYNYFWELWFILHVSEMCLSVLFKKGIIHFTEETLSDFTKVLKRVSLIFKYFWGLKRNFENEVLGMWFLKTSSDSGFGSC